VTTAQRPKTLTETHQLEIIVLEQVAFAAGTLKSIKIAKFCTKVSVMVTLSIDFPFFTVNKIYRKMFELPQFEVQV